MKNDITVAEMGRRLRGLRAELGLSLRACSRRAGVATSFLSKVEAGRASPTLMTLQKILESLATDLGTFFQDQSRDRASQIVCPRDLMKLVKDRDRRWWLAFPRGRPRRLSMTYEEYRPCTRIVERERHPTDLCGFVLAGELTLEIPGAGVQRARPGDAFYLPAGLEHVSRNAGRKTAKLVVVKMTGK